MNNKPDKKEIKKLQIRDNCYELRNMFAGISYDLEYMDYIEFLETVIDTGRILHTENIAITLQGEPTISGSRESVIRFVKKYKLQINKSQILEDLGSIENRRNSLIYLRDHL